MVDLESVFERLSGFPIRTFDAGELPLVEGSWTGELLFLLQGAVDVVKGSWHIARVDKPGAVFGDMAILPTSRIRLMSWSCSAPASSS
jgi:CRP-like cAMP-binding protein